MSGSKTIGQFVVSDTKNGIIVTTKSGDWQVKYSPISGYGAALKHHIHNADEDSLKMLLQSIYIASNVCITDAGFTNNMLSYLNRNLDKKQPDVNKDSDDQDLKVVKENQKLKDGLKNGKE